MKDNESRLTQKPSLKIDTAPTLETFASTSFESSAAGDVFTPKDSKALNQMSPERGGGPFFTPLPRERNVGIKVESPPTKRSSPERVIDSKKNIHCVQSRVFTDNSDYLPFGLHHLQEDYEERKKNLSQTFYNRCVSLKLEVNVYKSKNDSLYNMMNAEGQAFIVKVGKSAFMVTVKHNFCTEVNKEGKFEECKSVHPCFPGTSQHVNLFGEELVGWDADSCQDKFEPVGWKYGIETDVTLLKEEDVDAIQTIRGGILDCFETVSRTFKIKEGMLVGIMAHSNNGLLAKSMERQLGGGSEYKAENGDIFINVGKIVDVGVNHIEYNANTVHGFSGAPVFLLDAEKDYHMKVIAVHAGYNNKTKNNFGFLVSPTLHTAEESNSFPSGAFRGSFASMCIIS